MHSMPQQAPVSGERKLSELRRTTKPIMEKRRRARINNSLNELKNLILDYNKTKDSARHNNKLEKADILEMAVRHVQMLHRQMAAQRAAADPNVADKFRAGYLECASEVSRYLSRADGVEPSVRQCLANHLGQTSPAPASPAHVMPSPSSSPVSAATSPLQTAQPTVISAAAQKFFGNPNAPLVPTRLPSGQFALVLADGQNTAPHHLHQQQQQQQHHQLSAAESNRNTEISVNCNTTAVNVLGSSGILSPAASDRESVSPLPLLTSVSPVSPSPVKMELAIDESVWRPW